MVISIKFDVLGELNGWNDVRFNVIYYIFKTAIGHSVKYNVKAPLMKPMSKSCGNELII